MKRTQNMTIGQTSTSAVAVAQTSIGRTEDIMPAPVFVDDDGDAFELVGIIGEGAFGFVHFARSRKGAWMRRHGGRWMRNKMFAGFLTSPGD